VTWASGGRGQVLVGFETTPGVTPDTPTAYLMPINKSSMTGKENLNSSDTITGRRDPVAPFRGNKDVSGNITPPMDVRAIGQWLKAMFNVPTTTDVSTAGKLTGGTGVTTTIGTWTAVSDGRFKVAIDGSAATEVGPVDFSSGVTTMANVASKIQAAIRAIASGGFTLATVAFDAVNTCFVITSGTTGALSAVSLLTAPTSGTNIGATGFMKGTAGTIVAGVALYQHVFEVGDTQPSLFIEQGFTDVLQYFLYNGCKVSKAGFSFGGDGELTASIDVMGMKETLSTSSVDATPTEVSFDRFANFQATIKEGGAEIGICTEASLDIDLGLDGDTYCIGGNGFRSAVAEGLLKVSGKIKSMFQDATLLNKAINGTESSLQITLTNGNFILDLLVQELVYERATPELSGPKGIFVELPFQAYFDNGAGGSVVTATLTNDVASYAA